MKAFLLAAGEGRRLRPLTDTLPKCLVPIRGTPLLAVWLQLLEHAGVTEVVVTLHHAHERVLEFLHSYRTAQSVHTVFEPQLLGSAGTVVANRRFVEGEESFLILYADVLTNVDLQKMMRFHERQHTALTLGVTPTDRPREKGTVVLDRDRRVVAFEEKAAHPRSNLANAGIYVARRDLFEYLPQPVPGEILDFGHHVLPRMVRNLTAYPIDEFLMDIGTLAAYETAQSEWPGLLPAVI
jgi:mannose-1-phosphate guanylyltransferase